MTRRPRTTRAALAAAAATLAISGTAATQAGASDSAERASACPGTFQVLHNDRIGKLSLPAGPYVISVKRMTCENATGQFKRFLQNPNGNLPDNWRLLAKRKKFVNRAQNVAFLINRAG